VRRDALELLAASATALFAELALIRYLPGEVRVLAYFPNLVLISAFLGLGLGALASGRRSLLPAWPVTVLVAVLCARAAGGVAFTHDSPSEGFWLLYYDLGKDAHVVEGVRAPLVLFFILSATIFVPLGQAIALRLERMRDAGQPLIGYSWDLGGSLLGVVGFSLLSLASAPPAAWFGVFFVTALPLMRGGRARLGVWLACSAAVCALLAIDGRGAIYTPYYELRVSETDDGGKAILANGGLHQIAYDLRSEADHGDSQVGGVSQGYHQPYRALGRPIRKALVLGAGTGNDVAVLLDEGAQEVHAVEIDPGILRLGRSVHPADPYSDPRVKIFNTDGRAFLNDTNERYDVIVFGTLDSMTRLSALSNVRLDNFIYTYESLTAARAHLTEDGALFLFFMVGHEFIHRHLATMLTAVFGEAPLVNRQYRHLFNVTFLTGPGVAHLRSGPGTVTEPPAHHYPTDDWPYLYLKGPGVSGFYLSLIGLLLLVSLVALLGASPALRQSLRAGAVDWEMWLFGAGFLLLETKLVTSMNLVWGATWLTSAVVFGSILFVVLVGTLLSHAREIGLPIIVGGLLLTILATGLLPESLLVGRSVLVRLSASVAYVGAPIFFASLWFAHAFRRRPHVNTAFGWNLLGAVCGGMIEFSSMLLGLSAMHGVAGVIYLLVALLHVRSRGAPAP
jgi:hypothetical protein